ncbi:MAG: GAF domain-containing protein, partial [Deinococcus sp.]|nr:GAF domain-containing protein [Deinococcus sp.]
MPEPSSHADSLAAAILRVLRDINARLELDVLLQRIVEAAVAVIPGAQRGSLLVRSGERFRFAAAVGYDLERLKTVELSAKLDPILRQSRQGKVARLRRISQHRGRMPLEVARHLDQYGDATQIRATLAAPLFVGGELYGNLNLDNLEDENAFDAVPDQMVLLFAEQVAAAVENARLYERERRRRQVADTLLEVSGVLASQLNLGKVLELILAQLERVLANDSAALFLLEGDALRVAAALRLAPRGRDRPEEVLSVRVPIEQNALMKELITRRQPIVVSDVQADQRWQAFPGLDQVRSWIGVPLLARGQVIGYLTVGQNQPNAYGPEDGEVALAFAHHAANAIENARLY